ncbi:MAG: GNAT family N-acetyltransferase, partial [Myxococcales bacterium]|nr:GNAT family N-acetyltransferase [Myxococcales bacterium]
MSDASVRLVTDRLALVAPLDVSWAEAVAGYQARNRAHFRPWDPVRPEAFFETPFWRAQLEDDARDHRERRVRFFALEGERVIGHVHFTNIVRGAFQACHLGFGMDAERTGRGRMREALTAALAFAFDELRLHRVEANHRPENAASRAVLRHLGFVPQGYARDYLRIDGEWRDH